MIPTTLTIAGSDPSGCAGIQADLKTFAALKVYGMSAITALTAQNTTGVSGILEVPADFVGLQIDAVVRDIKPEAIKTGMLASASVLEVVATKIREYGLSRLVVDPVMHSTSGSTLLRGDGIDSLCRLLLPLALIVTPNIDEARVLTGSDIVTPEDMEEAARQIHLLGPKFVYIKGGHLKGAPIDVLFDGREFMRFEGERVATRDSHGTGCVLSAALAAYLARGESIVSAVRLSKEFVTASIRHGLRLGSGDGPCDPIGIEQR